MSQCIIHPAREATRVASIQGAKNPHVCADCFDRIEEETAQCLPWVEQTFHRQLIYHSQQAEITASTKKTLGPNS